MDFPPSELILNERGGVYHLGVRPEEIASTILLVGDPERVQHVARFFDEVLFTHQHREFITCTGTYQNTKLTVIATGIGTDNIDIVINELDALVNIDLTTRKVKKELTSLKIIRIGTCGILQSTIPLNSFILSTAALGLDTVPYYYNSSISHQLVNNPLLDKLKKQVQFPTGVSPYLTLSSSELNKLLRSEKTIEGITVTGCGFYAPQGRRLRLPLAMPNFIDELSTFNYQGETLANFEMECSALFALSNAFGHKATAICLGIANRKQQAFSTTIQENMNELIRYVLLQLALGCRL